MTFGEKLRNVREENNLTQEQLGERLFVSRQVVSKWETGVRYPDLLTAKKIAEIFNLSVDYFLEEDKLVSFSEKQPIIEDKKTNIIISALYAIIAMLSLTELINDLVNFGLLFKSGEYDIKVNDVLLVTIPMVFCLSAILISAYAFIKCLMADLNPKLAGVLGISYQVCMLARSIVVVFTMGFIIEYAIEFAIVIIFAVILYLYFIMNVSKLYKAVVGCGILFSIYFIANSVYHFISVLMYSDVQNNLIFNISTMVLYLSFASIIIVQAYYLERKRKLNK